MLYDVLISFSLKINWGFTRLLNFSFHVFNSLKILSSKLLPLYLKRAFTFFIQYLNCSVLFRLVYIKLSIIPAALAIRVSWLSLAQHWISSSIFSSLSLVLARMSFNTFFQSHFRLFLWPCLTIQLYHAVSQPKQHLRSIHLLHKYIPTLMSWDRIGFLLDLSDFGRCFTKKRTPFYIK